MLKFSSVFVATWCVGYTQKKIHRKRIQNRSCTKSVLKTRSRWLIFKFTFIPKSLKILLLTTLHTYQTKRGLAIIVPIIVGLFKRLFERLKNILIFGIRIMQLNHKLASRVLIDFFVFCFSFLFFVFWFCFFLLMISDVAVRYRL